MSEPNRPLDPRVKIAWRVHLAAGAFTVIVLAAVAAGIAGVAGVGPMLVVPAFAAVAAVCVAWVVFAPEVSYRRWRWDVADEEIRLREGLFVVTQTVIPMVRVQHVDTSQGPVMRMLGLAAVDISTAARKHSIPALSDEHAAELRDRIATLARVTDDGGL